MKSKKHTGSYYTPDFLANFIANYIAPRFSNKECISLLEPSVGNGSFIKAFNQSTFPTSIKKICFLSIEKIKRELDKAKIISNENKKSNVEFSFIHGDFLKVHRNINKKFSIILGNPPYIKKSLLKKWQIQSCQNIHAGVGLKNQSVKNIWSAFLLSGVKLLEEEGVLAFVLPAELLQVKFSVELRNFLTQTFQRTEVFTFDDLLFECKGQDTILFLGFKKHELPGQYYVHIGDLKQLERGEFFLNKNPALAKTQTKWSHHLLSSDELTFIHNISKNLKTVNFYCDSKPGIVTGANDFFIINCETESFYDLSSFVKPIIQKGYYINGSVVFDNGEFEALKKKGKPVKILCLSDEGVDQLPINVQDYLELGKYAAVPKSYKCSKRQNWFVVPNISSSPDGFFFRRVHHYPKLVKNSAKVLVTDSAYIINMRKGFTIESLISSFYNSLSLTFIELNGRYFGGGVLELTPSEFKSIPVPFTNVSQDLFSVFRHHFENKNTIDEILEQKDYPLLNSTLQLTYHEIEKIRLIRKKLIAKRFRSS